SSNLRGADVERLRSGGHSPAPLQLLDRPWPVILEQARQRSVRKHASPGLTTRAVVGLVLNVADALHACVADRAGLAVTPMHGHALAKGRHAFRELARGISLQPRGPVLEHGTCRIEQSFELGGFERSCQREW